MSLTRKIAHNTAIQAIGKGIGLALSLVTAGFVLRYLGQTGYGQYATVMAFLQIFGIIIDFGLYVILLKKISKTNENTDKLVNNIFTMRLASGVIFLGIAPVIGLFMPYPPIVKAGIFITTGFYLFVSLNQLLSAIFQKYMATYWIALGELIGKTTTLGVTLAFIFMGMDLKYILGAVVIGSGLNFLTNFIGSRKFFKIRPAFDFSLWKSVLKESWPIALSIFFTLIYFKGDTLVLSLFQPENEVGIYSAPYKMLEVIIAFPTMFIGLALPVLNKSWLEKNMDKYKQVLQKAFDFLVILAIPMVGGTIVLAEPIMRLLGGEEFIASAPVLQILIFATASIFLGTLFTYLVVTMNKQKIMLWGYSAVAIVSLTLYVTLIPIYSYWAAAAVTVLAEVAIFMIAYSICYRTSHKGVNLKGLGKALVATLAMVALLVAVPDINLFFSIILGGLVYFAVLFLFGGISRQQIIEIMALRSK